MRFDRLYAVWRLFIRRRDFCDFSGHGSYIGMVYLYDVTVNGNFPQICRHVPGGYQLHFFLNQILFFLCHIEFDLHCPFSATHALVAPFVSRKKKGTRGFVKILFSNTSDTPLYQQINCPFVLFVGTRKSVKRRECEEYIRQELII